MEDNRSKRTDPRVGFFDDLAAGWDEIEQDQAKTVEQVRQAADLLKLRSGEDVLEVGCGTGQLTGWLIEQVQPGRVVGIDFSLAMLEKAKSKGLNAEFQHADVCSDSLGSECFDLALCFHSFPHFRDQAAALKNLANAMKPTGRLIVMHLSTVAEINAYHDKVGGVVTGDHLPEHDQWDSLLSSARLKLENKVERKSLFLLTAVKSST